MAAPEPLSLSRAEIVERLQQHRTLGGAPRSELEWLAAHGQAVHADNGSLRTITGDMDSVVRAGFDSLIVVFSGRLVIYADHGAGPHKVMEWIAGDVAGFLPYSRMAGPAIGEMIIEEPMDQLFVNRAHFPEMIRECPAVTTSLVHVMIDRSRVFRASELQDEKMKSLGKLAAGLAHELNNPASASARSARTLTAALGETAAAARALAGAGLSAAQLALLDRARAECETTRPVLTGLGEADRQEAFADWLEPHGVDTAVAYGLADSGVTLETLQEIATALHQSAFVAATRWLANVSIARTLAFDIERATTSISKLVDTVKRFTYMDRALVPERVEVAAGLRDSIALLHHKARSKSIVVDLHVAPDGPQARAVGGDLNQVWINLLDNALDAAPESGRVDVFVEPRPDRVVVRIVDNGHGIAPEVRGRIFDPFFTSKPVGQGTGLGLDIARQLVRRNDGDIDVESQPGRTEFRVTLRSFVTESDNSVESRNMPSTPSRRADGRQ
jgi:signal transduction histidine kinase